MCDSHPAHSAWNDAGQPSQQIRSPPDLQVWEKRIDSVWVQLMWQFDAAAAAVTADAAAEEDGTCLQAPQHASLPSDSSINAPLPMFWSVSGSDISSPSSQEQASLTPSHFPIRVYHEDVSWACRAIHKQ